MRDDPATAGLAARRPAHDRHARRPRRPWTASARRQPSTATAAPFDADRNAAAFIVFTSGTTGKPKGVVHAHRWLEALGDSNRARVPPQAGDVILATGEWSFISALGHNVLFPLRNGTTGSIMEDRAAPERILQTIERDRVTLLHSVATLYRRILATPGIEHRYDLRSLRGANSTGEPLEDSVRKEWQARFGCPIWEHYGISEAQMVIGDGPGIAKKEGSTGKPWGARVAIVDESSERAAQRQHRHAGVRRGVSRLLPRLSRRRASDARDAARRLLRHQRSRPHGRRRLRLTSWAAPTTASKARAC